MRVFIAIVVASSAAITSPAHAHAHAWPNKPTTLNVPFPPGGGADVTKSSRAKFD